MQYFDFSYLVNKYSREFEVETTSDGYFDDSGDWQPGKPVKTVLFGAIISHRESKIFRSEGTITGQDRALYMLSPLSDGLRGAQILFEGKRYRIGDELNNADFTGVWSYVLKYVSPFEGGENGD